MAAAPLLLGLEIGGTKLQLALGRGDGRVVGLERRTIRPEAGASGILDQIEEAFGPLVEVAGAGPSSIEAAGIGFGGPVDVGRGVVTLSNQVEGWAGFPLAAWIRERLGIPVVGLENDADAAALGEARFGSGAGRSPVLYLTVGSGIGGGLIVDGRIYRGSGRGAAEIGQVWIEPPTATSPGRTLEAIASGWSIGDSGRSRAESGGGMLDRSDHDRSRITAAVVAEAAQAGDPVALGVLIEAREALAIGLAHAVNLMAPARIILGGGVSLIGEALWLGPIRERLGLLTFPPFRGSFDLVPTALGEEVVLHGALEAARQALAGV